MIYLQFSDDNKHERLYAHAYTKSGELVYAGDRTLMTEWLKKNGYEYIYGTNGYWEIPHKSIWTKIFGQSETHRQVSISSVG